MWIRASSINLRGRVPRPKAPDETKMIAITPDVTRHVANSLNLPDTGRPGWVYQSIPLLISLARSCVRIAGQHLFPTLRLWARVWISIASSRFNINKLAVLRPASLALRDLWQWELVGWERHNPEDTLILIEGFFLLTKPSRSWRPANSYRSRLIYVCHKVDTRTGGKRWKTKIRKNITCICVIKSAFIQKQ